MDEDYNGKFIQAWKGVEPSPVGIGGGGGLTSLQIGTPSVLNFPHRSNMPRGPRLLDQGIIPWLDVVPPGLNSWDKPWRAPLLWIASNLSSTRVDACWIILFFRLNL